MTDTRRAPCSSSYTVFLFDNAPLGPRPHRSSYSPQIPEEPREQSGIHRYKVVQRPHKRKGEHKVRKRNGDAAEPCAEEARIERRPPRQNKQQARQGRGKDKEGGKPSCCLMRHIAEPRPSLERVEKIEEPEESLKVARSYADAAGELVFDVFGGIFFRYAGDRDSLGCSSSPCYRAAELISARVLQSIILSGKNLNNGCIFCSLQDLPGFFQNVGKGLPIFLGRNVNWRLLPNALAGPVCVVLCARCGGSPARLVPLVLAEPAIAAPGALAAARPAEAAHAARLRAGG